MSSSSRAHRRLIHVLALVASVLLPPARVAAQDGLVLGAGGSRGLAHAGAIMGLERMGFDPDIVVGASIGAIVGGLYASGLSADSIWALTSTRDWQELFSPSARRPGPDGLPRRPMFRLGVMADQAVFPDGLVPEWRVNRLLVELFLDPAFRARGDFDALPRRFRSMAADLRTGERFLIAEGDLARAVRASMSVPGAFPPVTMQGHQLVDGGLADYLPVSAAREAGARRVVAVDVIRPPQDQMGLSPFAVALRSFRMTLHNARQLEDSADIAIVPDIDPGLFSAIFLRDPTPLLEAGLDATRTIPQPFETAPPADRTPLPAPESFAGLRVEANDPSLEALVLNAFEPIAVRGYDRDAILDAADELYATGLFAGIWPRVEAGAADTLVIFAQAYAPATIMGAGGYDTDRGFRAWAALERRLGGRLLGELAGSVDDVRKWASGSLRLRPSDRLVPLTIEAGLYVRRNDVRLFIGDEIVGESGIQRLGGWVGPSWYGHAPDIEVGVQVAGERIDDGVRAGFVWGPVLRITNPTPNADIVGTNRRLEAEWRFGEFEYRRLRAAGSVGGRAGPLHFAAMADVTSVDGEAPADALPALGDDRALAGLRWGRGRGGNRAVAGLDFALAAPLESHIRLRLRAGAIADELDQLRRSEWLAGAELSVLWWSPFGGLTLHGGVAEGGHWLFGLDVGPAF